MFPFFDDFLCEMANLISQHPNCPNCGQLIVLEDFDANSLRIFWKIGLCLECQSKKRRKYIGDE